MSFAKENMCESIKKHLSIFVLLKKYIYWHDLLPEMYCVLDVCVIFVLT